MKNTIISIIVPVYKVEKYLSRCITSILEQTFSDFELILIDDGSPDKSGDLCEEFAKKDARIRVIHQKNQGVSAARQRGLDNATGDYVIHADPDDWVEPDWLEELYKKSRETDADIVSCDYYKEYKDNTINKSERPTSFDNTQIIKDLLYEKIWGSTWNKLVRRDCFIKGNIKFNPNQVLWEDLMVITKLLMCGAKYEHIDIPLYHYDCFSNTQSIVRKSKSSHVISQKIYLDYIIDNFGDRKDFQECIYMRKLNVKRIAFYCGFKHNDLLIYTYPEINQTIISQNKNIKHNIKYYCIALCLRKHEFWGHLIYKLRNHLPF